MNQAMSPRSGLYFEEFQVGDSFTSQRRTITDADISFFAGWSWDTNPVHTDEVGGREGRFGSRIAHGLLGVSVAMGLVSRLGLFEGTSVALLGIREWKFVAPIRAGDTVVCVIAISGARATSSGSAGVLERHISLETPEGEQLQCGWIDLMVEMRPTDSVA